MQFDILPTSTMDTTHEHYNLYQTDCWNMSLDLRIENALSIEDFNKQYEERQSMNKRGYGGSDTGSWLLSLGQALLLSIFVWQPLVMLIWTIFCIWMFTWNLEISVWNTCGLCKRICCGPTKEDMLPSSPHSPQSPEGGKAKKSRASTADLGRLADTFRLTLRENPRQIEEKASSIQSMVIANESRPIVKISICLIKYILLTNDNVMINQCIIDRICFISCLMICGLSMIPSSTM